MVLEGIKHFIQGDTSQRCGFINKERWIKETSDGYSCLETSCEYNGKKDGLPLNEVEIYVHGKFLRRDAWICNEPSSTPSGKGVTIRMIKK